MLIPSDLNRFTAPTAVPPPDLSAVPEPELVRASQRGDGGAWGEIARRHHNRLAKFACSRIHHWLEAEEVAQDTLLRAWQAVATTDDRVARNLGVWLHTICARKCIDLVRRRRNRPTVSLEYWCEKYGSHSDHGRGWSNDDAYLAVDRAALRLETGHEPRLNLVRPSRYEQPDDAAERAELAAVLRAAVDRLPGHYRAYLRDQVEGGAGVREIAARHGATVPAVKATLYRARILLRAMPEVAALVPGR